MTTVYVSVVHTIGITPGWQEPHVVQIQRTITHTITGGPCLTPITLTPKDSDSDTKIVIDCGRKAPADRQCAACRITVIPTVTEKSVGEANPYLLHHAVAVIAANHLDYSGRPVTARKLAAIMKIRLGVAETLLASATRQAGGVNV